MGYTLAQVENLEKAIAEGALSVKYDGKETTYRSLDDMNRILNIMKSSLGINNSPRSSITGQKVIYHSDKGL